MKKIKTVYKRPVLQAVILPELMELISTSNTERGDPSTGRAKEMEIMEEEPEKIETGIPSHYHNIWEEDEE